MGKTTNRRQTKDSEFTTGSNVRLDYSNLSEIQSRNNHDLESNYTAKQSILKHEEKFKQIKGQLFGGGNEPDVMSNPIQQLQKNIVMKEVKTLNDIVVKLHLMQKELKILSKGNIVLVVGYTGCGKSTMLSSLIYGPDSLELTKVEVVGKGKKKQEVIDHKKKKKPELQIGHNKTES